ncbi:MAG TPA: twin-arginine translocase subunit TatB [Xanthobacteraceae bacterium]|nr:twin-arginine translocase subunit TatB [Xanthobacteraceae bacterium]
MFDFSSGELLLIALAVLIFIKPKDLPAVLRAIGQWTGKIRRMAGEFQDQFREAMREAEMADLKKDIDAATSKAAGVDPFSDLHESMSWKPPETTTTPPSADAPPAPPPDAVIAEAATEAPAAPPAPAPEPDVPAEIAPAVPPAGGGRGA